MAGAALCCLTGRHAPAPCSGLFIVSPTGILRQITVNDLPVGRSVDEVLRLVKAFQVGGLAASLAATAAPGEALAAGACAPAAAAPALLPAWQQAVCCGTSDGALTPHLPTCPASQFTDEHGEVCPANWRPGQKTMHADPVKSQEYFNTLS
jgi:alkyl hydroperoxide reductase subunit AhpC